jgi:hypothetical protein
MAGGGSSSKATQGVGGTQRIETTGQATTTKKGAKAAPPKKPAPKGSGSPSEPSGPGAVGAPAARSATDTALGAALCRWNYGVANAYHVADPRSHSRSCSFGGIAPH